MNLAAGWSYTPDTRAGDLNSVTNPYATAVQQDIKDQFMLGDYLLVAPMFTGEKTRKIVLPTGKWYDFYTGSYAGSGEVIEITPGLDHIPLYVKDGGIIPMIQPVQHAPRTGESLPLEIRFYGVTPGNSRLYDDDGETFDYEKGSYAWYPLNVAKDKKGKWQGQVGTRTGSFSQQQYSRYTWRFMTTL
jgi:alpha-D-xyloside xylohydrolase